MLNRYIQNRLKSSGWYPGRCESISIWESALEEDSIFIDEFTRGLLAEFGGLSVSVSSVHESSQNPAVFIFDPLVAMGLVYGEKIHDDYEPRAGCKLFPIGICYKLASVIMVGSDCQIYEANDGELAITAPDITSMLAQYHDGTWQENTIYL